MSERQTPLFGEQQGPALIPLSAYTAKEEKAAIELSGSEARAKIDAPTGLINKTTFDGITEDRIAAAEVANNDERPILALIKTDTDGFKQINDQLGHRVGDDYLADLATALPGWFRPEDAIALIGRVGGDEVDILLDLAPRDVYEAEHQQEAESTKDYSSAERLAAVIKRFNECKEAFFASQPEGIQKLHQKRIVDLAIGAVLWQPGWNRETLSKKADDLLYEVKEKQHAARDELERQDPNFENQAIARAKKMLEDAGRHDLAQRLNNS